jgi:pyridoxamine 5'-phosphate oxidase
LNETLAKLRYDYTQAGLSESDLDPDPIQQLARWLRQAIEAGLTEPNAMTLATATRAGVPSARAVLLKDYDARGLVFYTNYESQKGRELAENPRAALNFYWAELERQIRITGIISRVTPEESEAYFRQRPLGAQIGAWASQQSAVIPNREWLEQRAAEVAAQYQNQDILRPPHWGGYRLAPQTFEFWQGRPRDRKSVV